MASTRGPVAAAFAVVEITEAILLHLDSSDLLHAVTTSKTFLRVTKGSKALRATLYLEPTKTYELVGPRIFGTYAGYLDERDTIMRRNDYQTGDKVITALNPVFIVNDHRDRCWKRIPPRLEVAVSTEKLFDLAERSSPWMRMYVTRPATNVVLLECNKMLDTCDGTRARPKFPYRGWHSHHATFNVKISREAGVRLIDVYEAMTEFAAGRPGNYEEPETAERKSYRDDGGRRPVVSPPPFDLCHVHLDLAIPGHALGTSLGVLEARRWKQKYAELGWSGPFDEAQASAIRGER